MGALFSKFRGKKATITEAAPEVKEEDNATGAEVSQKVEPESCPEQTTEQVESNAKPEEAVDKKVEPAEEPTVKEVERVRETKLEKEKTVKDSGETTEKTVFTEYQETVRVEETKGPVSEPFPQKSSFPSFTELKSSGSKRPVDEDSEDVKEAVVKIQAGIRGYLTRKSLKEKRERGEPFTQKAEEVEEALTNSKPEEEECRQQNEVNLAKNEMELNSSPALIETEEWLEEEEEAKKDPAMAATKIQAAFRGYKVRRDQKARE